MSRAFGKGHYQELRAQGAEAIRKTIIEIDPRFAKHTESLTNWHRLSLLSVESNRSIFPQATAKAFTLQWPKTTSGRSQ